MAPPGIHVDDAYQGRTDITPVVLVHGAPDRSKNFRPVLDLLDDLPMVTYDRRGYGKSLEAEPPAESFTDHARDLIGVLDGRRCVVVAQSVGCNVAMTASTLRPDLFAALGLWEPPTAWADWWPTPDLLDSATEFAAETDTRALGERFSRSTIGEDRWQALPERTRDLLRREGAAFRTDMRSETTAPFDFADVVVPCVIGYGTNTVSGHYEGGVRLANLLGAEHYAVDGADHFAPITAPDKWAGLVRRAVALAERHR